MKKLFAVAVLGLAAVSSWAQGTVDFRNGGITFVTVADRFVYSDRVGGTKLSGTNMVAACYFAPGVGDVETIGVQAGRSFPFRVSTSQSIGLWNIPVGASSILTLQGVDVGAAARLQVRVWDGARFPTYQAAEAAGDKTGSSAAFAYTVPGAGSTPDKYYMDNLRAFALVPEPSTIALGVLGLAGLLALRRRK